MEDLQPLKIEFEERGFVVLRGFFNEQEVADINRRIENYKVPESALYEDKEQPETLKQMLLAGNYDAELEGLLHQDRVVQLAEALLNDKVIHKNLQWLNKPAKVGAATPPHQDGYYYMLNPNEAVAMWLALDDAMPENGCMRYVPGSHRTGLRNHARTTTLGFSQGITDFGPADLAIEQAIQAAPGDLIVHHSLTIHRADANQSDKSRRALQFVYFAERAKEDIARKTAYQQELQQDLAAAGKI